MMTGLTAVEATHSHVPASPYLPVKANSVGLGPINFVVKICTAQSAGVFPATNGIVPTRMGSVVVPVATAGTRNAISGRSGVTAHVNQSHLLLHVASMMVVARM